ncbi:MAG: VCBS repeat-containing protein [Ginsengibacter sp.]
MNINRLVYWSCIFFLSAACKSKNDTLFTSLPVTYTGIDFENTIADTDSLNILDYLYYYNGGGVAIADLNNDGLADIYFTSNQGSNKLYLNKGNLKFEDITAKAGVQGKGNWKTGVTIADVNGDGMLDIYVCEVGKYKSFHGANELFINNGDLTFTESAHSYGLDVEGFNTQSVFFDYDHDGDLDLFLVNHSVHSTDTYVKASARLVTNVVSGDKLFRNDSNHFIEVTKQANIYSSIIGYGLNAVVGDLNNDAWDDIYVSNDFHENDYYYVNQQDGTFKEMNAVAFGHESRFSMGSDIADINNDGWLDIITLDMLPEDEKVLKSSAGDDPMEIYQYKLSYGFHYQYSRNCVQLNRGGGKFFSDIALYAGVAATDWSWSALSADFNNDGIKDIFISNGILRRPNDLDFLKYTSGSAMYEALQQGKTFDLKAINKMPDGKWHNYIFKGTDSLKFIDESINWGFPEPSYSNGAAYSDLDNDGDLDLVINNINQPAQIYRNNAMQQSGNFYLEIELKGTESNSFAIGAKVLLKQNDSIQIGYVSTTKGFESSSLQYVHFGVGKNKIIDTVQIIWPDGNSQTLFNVKTNQRITVSYNPGHFQHKVSLLPSLDKSKDALIFTDITDSIGLSFVHHENDFNDFNVQPFIPHKVSTQGPKLAVADVNGDGLDDFFVCGAAGQAGNLYIQKPGETFSNTNESLFEADAMCEDVNALFFDADSDGDNDLYVVSGGNETEMEIKNLDRLYLNNGQGKFTKSNQLPALYGNKSVAAAADVDRDGDRDLFVGGRVMAGRYGDVPKSYLLLNDGKGKFSIANESTAPGLQNAGMITDAVFTDIDNDGWQDLVLAGEWIPLTIFKNKSGKFINLSSSFIPVQAKGLWTTIHIADINNDGLKDILAGNWGENSKLHANKKFPLKLYVNDFDNNGSLDQLLATERNGNYYSFLGKEELEKQVPSVIRKEYADYSSIAGKNIEEIFGEKLNNAKLYSADILASVVFINNKNSTFTLSKLPASFQWSPVFSFFTKDINHDGKNDIISGGNFDGVLPYEGRYDAGYTEILLSAPNGIFKQISGQQLGMSVRGEIRDIKEIKCKGNKKIIAVAVNNQSLRFFRLNNNSSFN